MIKNMAAGIVPLAGALTRPLLANESSARVLLDHQRIIMSKSFLGHQHAHETTFKLPSTELAQGRERISDMNVHHSEGSHGEQIPAPAYY